MPKGAPPPYDCQAPDTDRRTKKRPLSTIGGDHQHIHFVGKAQAINVLLVLRSKRSTNF